MFKLFLGRQTAVLRRSAPGGYANRIDYQSAQGGYADLITDTRHKKAAAVQSEPPQPFFCAAKEPICPNHGTSRFTSISVGLLTCVSIGGLPAFSDCSNDWLSPKAGRLDTYSAGSVGTLTPFSCAARQPPCAPSGHGNLIWFIGLTAPLGQWFQRVPPGSALPRSANTVSCFSGSAAAYPAAAAVRQPSA